MLPWNERVPLLSVHPDAATSGEVAKLASELMDMRYLVKLLLKGCKEAMTYLDKVDGSDNAWEIVQNHLYPAICTAESRLK